MEEKNHLPTLMWLPWGPALMGLLQMTMGLPLSRHQHYPPQLTINIMKALQWEERSTNLRRAGPLPIHSSMWRRPSWRPFTRVWGTLDGQIRMDIDWVMQKSANRSTIAENAIFRQPNLHHCMGYRITWTSNIVLKLLIYTPKTIYKAMGHLEWPKKDWYWLSYAKNGKSQHNRSTG